MSYMTGMFFDVALVGAGGAVIGKFSSVSGLSMEAQYEVYNEGGLNYPRFFFKGNKPQTLVLEQGVVTDVDGASLLMNCVNLGMSIPLAGAVILRDDTGEMQRNWTITGAHLSKYVGPSLNSTKPAVAVTRLEFVYNGCC